MRSPPPPAPSAAHLQGLVPDVGLHRDGVHRYDLSHLVVPPLLRDEVGHAAQRPAEHRPRVGLLARHKISWVDQEGGRRE